MEIRKCDLPGETFAPQAASAPDSLFERCSWFYALCREYLFRDHTSEIASSLFLEDGQQAGPKAGTRLVELGCGPGFYSTRFAELYPQIQTTGVDLSDNLLLRAKMRAARRRLVNCDFRRGDAKSLSDSLGVIDAVIVSRLFLIVLEREDVVREIYRVLRPGGRCFIAEPTSGFRTRIPLSCMWLLSKFPYTPAGGFREPSQAEVMTRPDFSKLIHSQPWASVDIKYDAWYQYAVCQKPNAVSLDADAASLDSNAAPDGAQVHDVAPPFSATQAGEWVDT